MTGVRPYSRVARDSLTDDQLTRAIAVISILESDLHARRQRYFPSGRYSEEITSELDADLDAVRELHALLVHERQERLIDDHETSAESE